MLPIVRKASGYFVVKSLQRDISVPDPIPSGHPLGIDLNLANFFGNQRRGNNC